LLFLGVRGTGEVRALPNVSMYTAERRLQCAASVLSCCLNRFVMVLVFCSMAAAAVAQPAPVLRMKSGAFVPPANVRAAEARQQRQARAEARRAADPHARQHIIVQFAGPLTAGDFDELRRAGATPLRYVPDHALAVVAPLEFDPATLRRARWAGELTPGDRLSAEAVLELQRERPRHPLMIVEFQPDVTGGEKTARLAAAGTTALPRPGLPAYMALVPADRRLAETLAADDLVAWVYPAHGDEAASASPVCLGGATPVGLVAAYATVGDGWDGPGQGSADLGYHVQSSTPQVGSPTVQAEIVRALDEWSRHIQVTWHQAASPHANRSLTILWGVGEHGDGYPFGDDVLAHAFYQAPVTPEPLAGDVHFNDAFAWGVGNSSRYDIFSVMLHEAGHSLGLAHSGDPDDVLYPIYRGIVQELATGDIAAARHLYASMTSLSAGWQGEAIGAGVVARASESNGRFSLEASGADIWSTADAFGFVSRVFDGDGDIVARVDSLSAVDRWTKAGVMIRASSAPSSQHAFMLVSAERGLAFQRRNTAGGVSSHTDGGPGIAPRWVWLSRRGDRFEAHEAIDGGAWRFVGADTIAMPRTVLAGLALTGHNGSAVAGATFSNVAVTAPAAWNGADVGAVGRAGSLVVDGPRLRVSGAGADIWDTADAFHFAWREWSGDGDVVARVASLQHTHHWAKAGVMVRASLEPGAPHAFMLVSADRGYAFQRRRAQGGISYHTAAGSGRAPQWVRLVRKGSTLTAYRSADGSNWVLVGTDSIPMGQTVLVGVAVTSHTTSVTSQAVFEHVSVR
jgi:regulation of enolase protein 1 (concanavalin A-like superfamily)